MIIQKEIKLKDEYYMHTYSDEGYYISRDGIQYIDALDPHFLGREYEETEEKIPNDIQAALFINQEFDLF